MSPIELSWTAKKPLHVYWTGWRAKKASHYVWFAFEKAFTLVHNFKQEKNSIQHFCRHDMANSGWKWLLKCGKGNIGQTNLVCLRKNQFFIAISRAAEYLERAEWGVGVWWLLVSGGAQNWPLWDMGKCLARTQRVLLCLLLITTERGSNHQHHQLHHHQHPYPHSWGGQLLSVNLNTLQT